MNKTTKDLSGRLAIGLAILALGFFFASSADATVTRVQSVSKNCANAAGCTVNIAPVQFGDLIVVTALIDNPWGDIPVTDNQLNSYTQVWKYSDGWNYAYSMDYFANVANAPTSVTVGTASVSQDITMMVVEYSGVIAISPLDVSATPISNWSSYSSSPVITNSANELLVGGVFSNSPSDNTIGTKGWTNFSTQNDYPHGNTISMQDQIVSASGTYANTGTASAGTNVVGMAAFVANNFPTYYVNPAASGNGSGSDWTNAFADFPATMVRGATYYVATGNYGSYLFNTPESGTSMITIKKATIADHGTSSGWNDAYGTGQAVFGNSRYIQSYWNFAGVNFSTGYWTFDGNTNSGIDPTGYGFTFKTDTSGTFESYLNINQAETATFNGMTFRNTSITCSGPSTHGEFGINAGTQANVVGPLFQYMYINDCNVNIMMFGSNWLIEHSYILNDWSGGPTSDLHGVPVDVFGVNDSTFRYNFLQGCPYNCIESNGGGGNYAGISGWQIYGNIFDPQFQTPVGIVSGASVVVIKNTKIYNNTIINSTGALLWEQDPDVGPIVGSGNVAQNNLFYNSGGTIPVFSENGGDPITYGYNSFWSSSKIQTCSTTPCTDQVVASGNPFVNLAAGNYQLTTHTSVGMNLGAPYIIDPVGNNREAFGIWDIGAYEFPNHVYYVDYVLGSDSNDGISESTPWKYAPGMNPFSGTYTYQAGDHFIFKGGITWPAAALPLVAANSGSSGNNIYYGVDTTWFDGTNSGTVNTNGTSVTWVSGNAFQANGSWNGGAITINGSPYTIASVQTPYSLTLTTSAGIQTAADYRNSLFVRPIFDGQSAVSTIFVTNAGVSYVTLDSIELKGEMMTNSNSVSVGISGATNGNILLENLDIHAWNRCTGNGTPSPICTSAVTDNSMVGGGIHAAMYSGLSPENMVLQYSNVGDPEYGSNIGGIFGMQTLVGNYIHDVALACDHGCSLVHDNVIYYVGNTFDGVCHTDVFYSDGFNQGGPLLSSATAYIYNNWIIDTQGNSTATQIYPNPGSAGVTNSVTYYVFNNVISCNPANGCGGHEGDNIDPYGWPPPSSNVYDWNNTYNLDSGSGDTGVNVDVRTSPVSVVDVRNLHCIIKSGYAFDPGSTIAPSSSNLLVQSPATAHSQGYISPGWVPTLNSGDTIAAGTNLSAHCSGILSALCSDTTLGGTRIPNPRPGVGQGNWDIGAYQHAAFGDISGNGQVTAYDAALSLTQGQSALEAALIAQQAAGLIAKSPVEG